MQFLRLDSSHATELARLDLEFGNESWTDKQFISEIENPVSALYGVFSGQELLAYAAVRILGHESELLKFYVRPEFRRKSLGRFLLEKVVSELQQSGCEILHLEVRTGNDGAIRFYTITGFVNSGRRKNYYKNPTEDAVLMHRMLIK